MNLFFFSSNLAYLYGLGTPVRLFFLTYLVWPVKKLIGIFVNLGISFTLYAADALRGLIYFLSEKKILFNVSLRFIHAYLDYLIRLKLV